MIDTTRQKLFVANAGDSRAVMGQGGKAVPLSFDHKPDNEEEIRRIEAAGSTITANPDTYEYDISGESDFVFMGCDGCWETKSNDEMVDWIYKRLGEKRESADLKTIVSELLNEIVSPDHVQTNGVGCDNMTC